MKPIKMNYLFALLFTLTTVTFGFAQNDAKKLLDQVSEKVKNYDNIFISFNYELSNQSENIKQETNGDVILKGDKYVLNILGITRIYDGKTLYSISPEDEEVTISSENTDNNNSITPGKILTFYNSGYRYEMDIKQNMQGRTIQYVKLIPINSNSEISKILLGIDSKTKHIYNLMEFGKNNSKTTLTVTSFKTNQPLPKNQFSFDEKKYINYYINRLD